MRDVIELQSESPEQTREVGRRLGEGLRGGELIELCGPLGAGKTQLAQGLALGLGVAADEVVVSPTFVLVREYAGRLAFYHCDAYRLRTAEELTGLGLEEALAQGGCVVAVEWADRFPGALPGPRISVELSHGGESNRRICVAVSGELEARNLASRLAASPAGPGSRR